jgi:hypothetical protein
MRVLDARCQFSIQIKTPVGEDGGLRVDGLRLVPRGTRCHAKDPTPQSNSILTCAGKFIRCAMRSDVLQLRKDHIFSIVDRKQIPMRLSDKKISHCRQDHAPMCMRQLISANDDLQVRVGALAY